MLLILIILIDTLYWSDNVVRFAETIRTYITINPYIGI
jgi:hypothetical protein